MSAHGYPHPGFRLAPKLLREILNVPIPISCIGEGPHSNLLLCDLDETAWITFAPKQCRKLADTLLEHARRQLYSSHNAILNCRFPKIPSGIELSDLELGFRAQNCLKQILKLPSVGSITRLENVTVREALATKALGVRTLFELLTSLEAASDHLARAGDQFFPQDVPTDIGPLNDQLTKEALKLLEMSASKMIFLNDPTLARHLGGILAAVSSLNREKFITSGSTLEDIANLIVGRQHDPADSPFLADQLRMLRQKIRSLSTASLESELRNIVVTVAASRAVPIILNNYGWDGQGPCTLQITGDRFGITRERVRQIVQRFADSVGHKKPFLPVLRKTLEFLRTCPKSSATEIEDAFVNQYLTEKSFALEGIAKAGEVFGLPIPFKVENLNGHRFVSHESLKQLSELINTVAQRSVGHWGIATLEDIAEQVKEKSKVSPDFELVSKILQGRRDFVELDKVQGWFWLSSIQQTHLVRHIRKVLAVSPKVLVSELRSGIARYRRLQGFSPPRRVLLELCRHLPFCSVDEDSVVLIEKLSLHRELNESELQILRLLKENGPVVEWAKFRDACVTSGMNISTFTRTFLNSPIFSRCARRLYYVTGEDIPPGLVEELSERRMPSKVLQSFGWIGHQKLWVGYKLSEGLLRSGVATIPTTLRAFAVGEFVMKDENNSRFGTLITRNGQAWGLLPFFRRRGGDPGDFICLKFDLASREVHILMGDESVVYPDNDTGVATEVEN